MTKKQMRNFSAEEKTKIVLELLKEELLFYRFKIIIRIRLHLFRSMRAFLFTQSVSLYYKY